MAAPQMTMLMRMSEDAPMLGDVARGLAEGALVLRGGDGVAGGFKEGEECARDEIEHRTDEQARAYGGSPGWGR